MAYNRVSPWPPRAKRKGSGSELRPSSLRDYFQFSSPTSRQYSVRLPELVIAGHLIKVWFAPFGLLSCQSACGPRFVDRSDCRRRMLSVEVGENVPDNRKPFKFLCRLRRICYRQSVWIVRTHTRRNADRTIQLTPQVLPCAKERARRRAGERPDLTSYVWACC